MSSENVLICFVLARGRGILIYICITMKNTIASSTKKQLSWMKVTWEITFHSNNQVLIIELWWITLLTLKNISHVSFSNTPKMREIFTNLSNLFFRKVLAFHVFYVPRGLWRKTFITFSPQFSKWGDKKFIRSWGKSTPNTEFSNWW